MFDTAIELQGCLQNKFRLKYELNLEHREVIWHRMKWRLKVKIDMTGHSGFRNDSDMP